MAECSPQLELDPEQLAAVELCLSNRVSVLLGEPGTGKTTVVAELYQRFMKMGKRVLIVGPTAKAASRARSLVPKGAPAFTADKMCRSAAAAQAHRRWRHCALIMDETSMADPVMIVRLLRTLRKPGEAEPCVSHVVFVGDDAQLRPVNGVPCLRELATAYPSARLTKVYRQNAGSALYANIRLIKEKPTLRLSDFFVGDDSFEIVNLARCEGWSFLRGRLNPLPAILCFTNKERAAITEIVQQAVNPLGVEIIAKHMVGGSEKALTGIRLGDPVVCTKNAYAKSDSQEARQFDHDSDDSDEDNEDEGGDVLLVSNGTPGVFTTFPGSSRKGVKYRTVAPNGQPADFWDLEDLTRGFHQLFLTKFEHGYVYTVHKAQGDQYDCVLAVVEPDLSRCERSLLYTAVSRAKLKCILCTSDDALQKMDLPPPEAYRPETVLERALRDTRS